MCDCVSNVFLRCIRLCRHARIWFRRAHVSIARSLLAAGRIAEVGRALRARHLAETGVQRTALHFVSRHSPRLARPQSQHARRVRSPANVAVYLPAISRTTRKRALPLIIRSDASAAFSKGKISFMECTSADALNSSVSCESMEAPEYQPFTDR